MGALNRTILLCGLLVLVLLQQQTTAATTDHDDRHLLYDGLNLDLNSQLRDTTRQEKQAVIHQQISRATALGGNKETVAHATGEGTRDGRDYGRDVVGHLDRHLLYDGLNLDLNSQLRDTTRQEKQAVIHQQISRATALGGNKETVAHATGEGTRDGRDYGRDVVGHLDRRLSSSSTSSNRRMLSGRQLQDNMAQAGADLGLNDSLREAAAAEARSRIKAAVAGGAARDSVTSAALRSRAIPLLLRR